MHLNTLTERALFQNQGFLIFDPGIPVELLDAAVAETSPLFKRDGDGRPTWRLQDAWEQCPAVKALALFEPIHTMLANLHNRTARAFQTLNFPVGTQQAAHSDTIHFDTQPPGLMAGVWIALEAVDYLNGPLFVYPGSHKLPAWRMEDAGATLCTKEDMSGYTTYEQFIGRQIAERGLSAQAAVMPKGHAIIWAANLLHGGSKIGEKQRSRHSQVTHYYFEGATGYTSHISGTTNKLPRWIA